LVMLWDFGTAIFHASSVSSWIVLSGETKNES
jgi:hypothetical protein